MPPSLLVPVLGAALAGLAPPAVLGQHDPPVPPITPVVVPASVPTHDWAAETVRLGMAVALAGAAGVVIGARTAATRLRRREQAPETGLIDITDVVQVRGIPDVVQSRGVPDEIQFGPAVRRPAGSP